MTRRRPIAAAAALLLAATLAAAAPDPGRLGHDVRPVFQTVELRLDPAATGYSGTVEVRLEIERPVDRVSFHAEELQLDRVALTREGRPLDTSWTQDGPIVAVVGAEPFPPGSYRLVVEFGNDYDTRAESLYRVETGGKSYLFSQFEADDARRAFPCWDEPSFKIPFEVILSAPAGLTVVANAPEASAEEHDGWRTVRFRPTPPLPSYLVAIAVGPFDSVPIEGLAVPARIYTVAGQSALARTAAEMTPPILAALERWFATPYPYEKLDFIGVPEYWAGAMEHPGAVTYRDSILLMDPDQASVEQRRRLARITAHELAHMWFGNLVTMAWWDDLWLNESFADWMGDKIAHQVHPELGIELDELSDVQGMMRRDMRPSTSPIRRPLRAADDLFADVGTAYVKGRAILAMYETWVGPDRFRDGVHRYLKQHAWGNATSDELWRALSAGVGIDLRPSMASFVDLPGLPQILVEPSGAGRLRLRQRPLVAAGGEAGSRSWIVPITLAFPEGERVRWQSVLLGDEPLPVELGHGRLPAWVLPNAGATGYYRWSLPLPMLDALIDVAPERLSPRERVELLGNLASLLDAGEMAGDVYLERLARFGADPDPEVVAATIRRAGEVRDAFVPAELESAWAAWVRRAFAPALRRIGLAAKAREAETVTLLRSDLMELLGDEGRDPDVFDEAGRITRALLEDPASVDPSLAPVAVGLIASAGDAALFDRLRGRFESAEAPVERALYLRALGRFREPALIERALDYSLHGPLRPNELFAIAFGVARHAEGRARLYAWLERNYDELVGRIPPTMRPFLARAARGCSLERVERARAFLTTDERTVPGVERQLAQVADEVRDCASLREREGESVARYLRRPVPDSEPAQ